METMYQRGKIQDESMYYEHPKYDGTLPIVGVNTFQNPNASAFDESSADDFEMELARATPEEKQACLDRGFKHKTPMNQKQRRHQEITNARDGGNVCRTDGNCQVCESGTNRRFVPGRRSISPQ